MRLLHYSDAPVTFDRGRVYDQNRLRGAGKPVGLWVSVEGPDDWKSWCESEKFHLSGLAVAHEVTLTDDANLITITTGRELDEFHKKWTEEDDFNRRMAARRPPDNPLEAQFRFNQWPIPWGKVAAEFDGILIPTYLWSHRLDGPLWYCGWDCASGCIWNLSAVASFEPVECNP